MKISTQTKLFRGCMPRLGNDTVDFVVQIVALEALEARFPSLAQAFRLKVIQYSLPMGRTISTSPHIIVFDRNGRATDCGSSPCACVAVTLETNTTYISRT